MSGTIWTSGLGQLTEFQKVQKSLIKGIIVVVSEVNKLIGNSEIQKEETVCALMDGVLLLANANQELNYRRREFMRPQLNTNYRHLCSPSNPVTAELFGDDLPKAVKDITDTNRLEWSGFDPWPGSLCCILRQDTLLSVLLFTQVYKWVPANMLGQPCDGLVPHPGGSSNTPRRFMLRKPDLSAGPMLHLGLYKGFFNFFKIPITSSQRI